MAVAFAWLLLVGTPLAILSFLVCFLVWMGQGRHDTWFTRACDRLMVPSGIAVFVCLFLTLRYF